MKTDVGLTKEQFDQLLDWFDPDPVRAGEKYEKIRRRLITIFLNRNCQEAEDWADETINRVAKRVGELKDTYVGDPARYFYGVAKKVLLEYHRQHSRAIPSLPPAASHEELERPLACLDGCLAQFSPENRELILRYYQEQKRAKIESHKELGEQMRLRAGALRARIYRLRAKLEKCVKECLKGPAEGNDI
jgi:RNA polymerase sigma factor (sigma-70 family)